MAKVSVMLYFKHGVQYEVDVPEPTPQAIRNALLQKDPSDWVVEPNLYENVGNEFFRTVSDISDTDLMLNSEVATESIKQAEICEELGGDPSNDCAGCVYSPDYHLVNGECVKR